MADPCAKPAIGAGQHILAPDEARVAHEALGDEIGVLDEIGAMADDAGDEGRAVGQLQILEDPPFVLVTRVGGLNRIAPGIDPENEVNDVLEREIGRASCRERVSYHV